MSFCNRSKGNILLVLTRLDLLNTTTKTKGFSLVELVLAISIFMIYAGSLVASATGSHLTRLENAKFVKGSLFFQEGWEIVRSIRNNNWSDITNGDHGVNFSGNIWHLTSGSDVFDGFIRTITIDDVRRDVLGNIVVSGGTIDPDTKLVRIEVEWTPVPGKSASVYAESYLTNYKNPGVWPPE
jgi:type II secretory pathway pseudopilin PulG